MSLKALIFDVDGTLANTEDAHRLAFNQAFQDAGFGWAWDRALYRELLAVTGGRQRIRHFLETTGDAALGRDDLDVMIADLHKNKTRHFVERLEKGQVPLRPGIEALIREAREKGMTIAIATTTSPVNVETLIRTTLGDDALDWFAAIGDGGKVPVLKPEPDVYDWVVDQLDLLPEETLALEDSKNGVVAACAANVPVLVVTNDYTEGQDFTGAIDVLETFEGLDLDGVRRFYQQHTSP